MALGRLPYRMGPKPWAIWECGVDIRGQLSHAATTAVVVAKQWGRMSNLINLTTMPHKGKQMQLTFNNQSCHQFVQFWPLLPLLLFVGFGVWWWIFNLFSCSAARHVNKIRRKMRTSGAYEKSSGQKVKRKCYFVAPNPRVNKPPTPPPHLPLYQTPMPLYHSHFGQRWQVCVKVNTPSASQICTNCPMFVYPSVSS